jgi:hypothetical protein
MSVPSSVVRELGATIRTFSSVQSAMKWWWRHTSAEVACEISRNFSGSQRTEADRDMDAATAALLCKCLEQRDPAVDTFTLHYVRLFEAWCCSFDSQQDLADNEGFRSLSDLRRTMRFTENVLRMRMEFRGLLR